MFGVLTHADKIDKDDTDFPEFEKKFKTSLGLTGMRYLLCSSYCDEISSENRRIPKIEVPVMRFLRQVRQFYHFQSMYMYMLIYNSLPECLHIISILSDVSATLKHID